MDFKPQPKAKPIRLKGKAYSAFRKQVFEQAGGICSVCGRYAPLMVAGVFDRINCGHVAHIKSRGSGGSDTIENTRWKCKSCHNDKEHSPRWSNKTKEE